MTTFIIAASIVLGAVVALALVRKQIGWLAVTKKQIKTITCALFHDGIDIEKLSEAAKVELRDAVKILLAAHYGHEGGRL